MTILTKLAVASVLALAAAPALAASAIENTAPEALTQLERNTYLFTPDARPATHNAHVSQSSLRAHAASEAYASAPAVGSVNDRFSVENQ